MTGPEPTETTQQQAKPCLLVIDDDRRLCALLRKYLIENGFVVTIAHSAAQGRKAMALIAFDLIVVDWMMPGESGIDFVAHLVPDAPPTLLLTARGEAEDRILGLEAGSDDYLTKPFEPRELVLRINAILWRAHLPAPQKSQNNSITIGPLAFDPRLKTLTGPEGPIALTETEGRLLSFFTENINEVVDREMLAQGTEIDINERSIDVQITRLRRKLGDDPKAPRYLQTVRGRGYVLRTD